MCMCMGQFSVTFGSLGCVFQAGCAQSRADVQCIALHGYFLLGLAGFPDLLLKLAAEQVDMH